MTEIELFNEASINQAILTEKKRIENIIARDFHEHDDEEKNRNCEHNKALREILKKI